LRLSDGGALASRTVIIASGAAYRRLGIPALEDLQGRGVFYGAAVGEAPAMRGRDVFVTGGRNSAGQTALHLAKWALSIIRRTFPERLLASNDSRVGLGSGRVVGSQIYAHQLDHLFAFTSQLGNALIHD
jgi:alkyl hydroperoxide reductase subunit AhpF